MALHQAWGMPGPVAGDSNSVVPAGCPEDLWINYRKLQKSKSSGRARFGGLNGSFGCTKLEIHLMVEYVTKHASNFVTKSVVVNIRW